MRSTADFDIALRYAGSRRPAGDSGAGAVEQVSSRRPRWSKRNEKGRTLAGPPLRFVAFGVERYRPLVRRPTSMKRRILPLLLKSVPFRSQNSIRFPVPVCTFTIMSLTMPRSRGSGTSSQGS